MPASCFMARCFARFSDLAFFFSSADGLAVGSCHSCVSGCCAHSDCSHQRSCPEVHSPLDHQLCEVCHCWEEEEAAGCETSSSCRNLSLIDVGSNFTGANWMRCMRSLNWDCLSSEVLPVMKSACETPECFTRAPKTTCCS